MNDKDQDFLPTCQVAIIFATDTDGKNVLSEPDLTMDQEDPEVQKQQSMKLGAK